LWLFLSNNFSFRKFLKLKGDHRQYKHPSKKGLVTISGHFNEDVAKGTLNSILKRKQAGLKEVKEDG